MKASFRFFQLLIAMTLLGLLSTAAHAQAWTPQNSGITSSLQDVAFVDANYGWAVGNGGTIVHTTDGGTNWAVQVVWTSLLLSRVAFTDFNNGWAVSHNGVIQHTSDGGTNWGPQSIGAFVWAVTFADVNNGWAVGGAGTILHTTNEGTNWVSQSSGTMNLLYGVAFADASKGWAVGQSGTILNTTDEGANWVLQSSGTTSFLSDVAFVDESNGWAVGDLGTIVHTTDGGSIWVAQSSGTAYRLEGVAFTDASNGWVVGNGGTILHTSDGGTNWVSQSSGTTNPIMSVAFPDANNGWAVGSDGTILHYVASLCVVDDSVTLVPDNPDFPGPQEVHACARLLDGFSTQIVVPVTDVNNTPVISITAGCQDCDDNACDPLSNWILGPWTFNAATTAYSADLTAGAEATGCCVCIHLDQVLPVELTSFEAIPGDCRVILSWTTASETSTDHFELLRDDVPVANVHATNRATGSSYTWTDNNAVNGTLYNYTLVSVDVDGTRENLRTVNATPHSNTAAISEYALYQNYPNPFNPTTSIAFDLAEAGNVFLTVHNLMGQEMASLVSGSMSAGHHTVNFDASGLSSGVYLYRLNVNGFDAEQKMLLMK